MHVSSKQRKGKLKGNIKIGVWDIAMVKDSRAKASLSMATSPQIGVADNGKATSPRLDPKVSSTPVLSSHVRLSLTAPRHTLTRTLALSLPRHQLPFPPPPPLSRSHRHLPRQPLSPSLRLPPPACCFVAGMRATRGWSLPRAWRPGRRRRMACE